MKIKLHKKYSKIITIVVIGLLLPMVVLVFKETFAKSPNAQVASVSDQELPSFTKEELKKYDGTDLRVPIYLALDGFVYDVSKGVEFYKVGGPYHYLAGKDSSFELHIVGADVIRRKYPVIGKLENTK